MGSAEQTRVVVQGLGLGLRQTANRATKEGRGRQRWKQVGGRKAGSELVRSVY